MLVSIVSPDLSDNCLGRAYVLAQLIERNYDIEIVGPKMKKTIWEPIRDKYDYKGVKTGSKLYQFPFAVPDLLDHISGDIVYVSKPRIRSYGLGLLSTIGRDKPLILDIDDWEAGFNHGGRQEKKSSNVISEVSSYYDKFSFERLSRLANVRTVSNQFLQNRFGGTIIPHAKDTDKLDPRRFDKQTVRNELNLPPEDFLVMFSGTPRTYKGVDNLAKAVDWIDCDSVRAVVVGAHDSEYVDKVRQLGGDSIIIRGMQPFDEIPKWLAAADSIAIPQKDSPATWGQMPSKVFDAMAMAKPIIASNVSDLPTVLKDCGIIIEPGNVRELRDSILKLYNSQELCDKLGIKARQRCVKKYSYEAVSPQITELIQSV